MASPSTNIGLENPSLWFDEQEWSIEPSKDPWTFLEEHTSIPLSPLLTGQGFQSANPHPCELFSPLPSMQFDSDLAAPLLWPEIPLGAAPQQLNDSISLPPQPSIEKPQDNPHASKSPEKGISKPTTANGDIVAKSQPSRTSHQKPAQPK
ncbi:hypothetical protein FQN52_004695 [Onygenales sp. PD_12]|nr:hypothetical protein FQN52_004695 [Onygenales sp. PD_12]